MTAVVTLLSAGEAQRLTQRIKLVAGSVRDNLFKLRNLVDEAKSSNVWSVLGYESWTAYLADTLGSEPMRLGREERRELVEYLSGEGMSTRAIAPVLGVSHMQVKRDRDAGVTNVTPEPEPVFDPTPTLPPRADDWVVPGVEVNPSTGEVIEVPAASEPEVPRTVTGLDGKNYTMPAAPKQRRGALIDDARSAGWQLRKAIERVERIKNDDRFRKNEVEILAALRPHLDFAGEVLADLTDQ